jgi:hypothetical protein
MNRGSVEKGCRGEGGKARIEGGKASAEKGGGRYSGGRRGEV